ncbi:gas vesicle protein GvpO [Actinophytocola sp.]|uniref:gas vesicle protein GvpO n=1 Tax=Actinophytocola sp. TaxID=1872138 RepID=UPI002ED6744E
MANPPPHHTEPAEPRPDAETEFAASAAGAIALHQIARLVRGDVLGVTAIEPINTGWLVEIETIETHRIPPTADILSLYQAELDPDGNLLAYRRTTQYTRGNSRRGNKR